MFKKMLIVCAGLIISTKAANAQIFAPVRTQTVVQQQAPATTESYVFVGELDGKPLVLQVFPNGSSYTGRMTFGTNTLPCDGENHNGQITGTVRGENGKLLPFTGTLNNGRIELTLAGQTIILVRQEGNLQPQQPTGPQMPVGPQFPVGPQTPAEYAPRPTPVQPAPVQPTARGTGAIDRNAITVVKTQYFSIPMPQGWRHQEDKANALVISPDGMTAYGVTGRNVAAGTSAEAFMRNTLADFRVQNLQIINQATQDTGDSEEFDATVTFTGPDGRQRQGIMKAYKMKNSNFAILIHAATPVEDFAANGQLVGELAGNIGVVKPTAQAQAPAQAPVQNQPVGFNPLGR